MSGNMSVKFYLDRGSKAIYSFQLGMLDKGSLAKIPEISQGESSQSTVKQ